MDQVMRYSGPKEFRDAATSPRSIHPSPSIKLPILLINRVFGPVSAFRRRPGIKSAFGSSCSQTTGQLGAKQRMRTAAGAHLNYSLRVLAGFFDEPALEDALGAAKDGPRCSIGKREPLKPGGTYLECSPCFADVLPPSHRTYA